MEFKDIFKDLFEESGLTQKEFALKLGIKQGHLSEWLRGISKPSYDHLKNICLKLEISGDKILGLSD